MSTGDAKNEHGRCEILRGRVGGGTEAMPREMKKKILILGLFVGGGTKAMPREIKKKILMLDCLRLHFVRFEMSEIERQAGQDRP